MSEEGRHAGHVAAGLWSEQCPHCAETDGKCREIEAAGAAAALELFEALSVERRREVLRRLEERGRLPAATIGSLYGVAGGPDAAGPADTAGSE